MMKKNIVFVIPSLGAGGAEKSLVNLLNTIDYEEYNVDLVLFKKAGVFLSLIPKEVVLVDLNANYKIFAQGLLSSCFTFLMQLKLGLLYNRIMFFVTNKRIKNVAVAEQKAWQYLSDAIAVIPKKYDAAIGFLEKSSIYFTVDKIQAKHKIGWIHTTYSKSGMDPNFDENYFNSLQAVIAVSPECVDDLKKNFPKLESKFKLIYNIVSSQLIHKLALEDFDHTEVGPNSIVTIARLSPEKGCDIALDASCLLRDMGIDFTWMVIGDGPERASLEKKIKEQKMERYFQLLGVKKNPYPYLLAAKMYVQPSRYEGKSMAIEEAKILRKPIVITNFSSAKDQISHLETGIISKTDAASLAEEIKKLLSDHAIQEKLVLNLSSQNFGTEAEIQQLYQLINE